MISPLVPHYFPMISLLFSPLFPHDCFPHCFSPFPHFPHYFSSYFSCYFSCYFSHFPHDFPGPGGLGAAAEFPAAATLFPPLFPSYFAIIFPLFSHFFSRLFPYYIPHFSPLFFHYFPITFPFFPPIFPIIFPLFFLGFSPMISPLFSLFPRPWRRSVSRISSSCCGRSRRSWCPTRSRWNAGSACRACPRAGACCCGTVCTASAGEGQRGQRWGYPWDR